MSIDKNTRRKARNRYKLKKLGGGKLRLSIHRSPRHIYAQIIDDSKGITVASASTAVKELAGGLKSKGNVEAAKKVGEAIGQAAQKANIKQVVFDRGGYKYHGRVKALAEAARASGLEF
jgi:large subunit ribosomal protein L18